MSTEEKRTAQVRGDAAISRPHREQASGNKSEKPAWKVEDIDRRDQEAERRLREITKRKRERWAIVTLFVLLVGLTIFEIRLAKVSSTLPFLNSIFFFGLINFNIILLMTMVFLIFKNVGKLVLERRRKIFGSQLKSKLVLSFLCFSLIPTALLFIISSFYINSSFDKWFSVKIENTLQNSIDITNAYYNDAKQTAKHFSKLLTEELKTNNRNLRTVDSIAEFASSKGAHYGLDAIEFYPDPFTARIDYRKKDSKMTNLPLLSVEAFEEAIENGERVEIHQLSDGDVVRSLLPIPVGNIKWITEEITDFGVLSVSKFIPQSLTTKVQEISGVRDDYTGVNPLQYPIKTIYFVILVMMTLLIVFAAIWIGLYLAKSLTEPLARLSSATKAVASGNLDVKLENPGNDEISTLVESFNTMTSELKENRVELELTHGDLVETNKDLYHGKIYIETLLKNVAAGVLSIDVDGNVATINRTAEELLGTDSENAVGKPLSEVLPEEFQEFMNKETNVLGKVRQGFIRLKTKAEDEIKSIIIKVTPVADQDGVHSGAVIVFEEITNLIKAQREAAWREVARRIAHEIKNPLTPIKLSANRLRKRFMDEVSDGREVFDECTQTIINQVDGLRDMVNEFSAFARFPAANPTPQDLNKSLEEVYHLYSEAHKDVEFVQDLAADLPVVEFDREQIKRTLINLLENSIAALHMINVNGRKSIIRLTTRYQPTLQLVQIEVFNNGPPIPEEMRERIFEPYFSTKAGGTGLGLAICHRIVSDHSGFIRVQNIQGEGVMFLIELPLDAGLAKPANINTQSLSNPSGRAL